MKMQVLVVSLGIMMLLAPAFATAGDTLGGPQSMSAGRLQQLGLQSMQVVSDDEGIDVRGTGFAGLKSNGALAALKNGNAYNNGSHSLRGVISTFVQHVRSHIRGNNGPQ